MPAPSTAPSADPSADPSTPPPADKPGLRALQREATRTSILDAALVEFSEHGFDGTSTRNIAARAGAHHALIKYHFETKELLWKAAVNFLFERQLAWLTLPDLAVRTAHDRRGFAREVIRQIVRYSAKHPEHARLMVQESCRDTERLHWAAETHIARMSRAAGDFIQAMQAEGVFPPGAVAPMVYMLVGAAQLFHALAPEVRLIWGVDPGAPESVEAHAEAMASLFVRAP